MWPQILVFLSWLSSLGSAHPSIASMFLGFTGRRDDSVIESWNLRCQNEARSWQVVQAFKFIGEETEDRERKMTFKVSPTIYRQIWDYKFLGLHSRAVSTTMNLFQSGALLFSVLNGAKNRKSWASEPFLKLSLISLYPRIVSWNRDLISVWLKVSKSCLAKNSFL